MSQSTGDAEARKLWRSAMLQLPDRTFFDILRNYLGPVKTPYHKPELIDKLEAFLRRPDIQDAAVDLCSPSQANIIATLAFLGPVRTEELLDYLQLGQESLEVFRSLSVLEDRLILFKDSEYQLRFNPHLERRLVRQFATPQVLFPSVPRPNQEKDPIPWPNDLVLLSLYLILPGFPGSTKQDLGLSKRFIDEVAKRIPHFLSDPQRTRWALLGLQYLGLIVPPEEPRKPIDLVGPRWDEFLSLSARDRALNWWAAIISASFETGEDFPEAEKPTPAPDLEEQDEISYFVLELVEDTAVWVGAFLDCLPEGQLYDEATLLRLVKATRPEQNGGEISASLFLEGLKFAQALSPAGPKEKGLYGKNENLVHLAELPAQTDEPLRRGGLVVNADGGIHVQAWVPPECLRQILPAFSLQKADYLLHLRLDKTRSASLFRAGIDGAAIASRLENLSGNPVPQGVRANLDIWHQEFSSVRADEGIVLTLSKERETRLLHHPVAGSVLRSLAPGICFLPKEHRHDADLRRALAELGIVLDVLLLEEDPRMIGLPEMWHLPKDPGKSLLKRILKASADAAAKPPTSTDPGSTGPRLARAAALRRTLTQRLEELSFDEDLRRELTLRIDTGIILSPEQLHPGLTRPEQTLAGGLDHTAKLRLIETAIQFGDLLEIQLTEPVSRAAGKELADPQGESTLLVLPVSMSNRGGMTELRARRLPEFAHVALQVSRFRQLRRLKGGLFKMESLALGMWSIESRIAEGIWGSGGHNILEGEE